MGDGGKNSRVVLHPRVSGKRAEIERLRGALAVLLEEIDSLLSWKRDAILARYARDIGGNSEWTGIGAGAGMASGAGLAHQMATDPAGASKRIIDRCMAGRGHNILNDLGAG